MTFTNGGRTIQVPAGGVVQMDGVSLWNHLIGSGGTGSSYTVKMPFAFRLKLGMAYTLSIQNPPSVDVILNDWNGGVISVSDMVGNSATFVDVSDTAKWGIYPCIRVRNTGNADAAGSWLAYYVGDGS